jgi:hypothetical protein
LFPGSLPAPAAGWGDLPIPPLLPEPVALPEHLARFEAHHRDNVPGTEKQLLSGPAGACRAARAVVYLHGFSATRQETSPLSEQVAQALARTPSPQGWRGRFEAWLKSRVRR